MMRTLLSAVSRTRFVVVLLTAAVVRPAEGQFALIEHLFGTVKEVAFFVEAGRLTSTRDATTSGFALDPPNGLRGWGLELLLDMSPGATESSWNVTLGLGYNYMTGFVASDPSVDLRGSMRGLPTVAVYGDPPGGGPVYFGASIGLTELWNTRAFDQLGQQYGVGGQTFELGYVIGLETRAGFFVEGAYRVRDFRSLDWRLPGDSTVLPANWPRSLDLSAVTLSIGYHIKLAGSSP